jgi:hypothetical protein
MQESSLHDLVTAYRASGSGREQIIDRVIGLVYSSHERFGFDDEDDAANALYKYRARIGKLVDRFEDRGLPFDAYLVASLRYLAKTVRRERKKARERESVCESTAGLAFEGSAARDPALESQALDTVHDEGVAFARAGAKRRPRARGGFLRCGASEAAAYSSRLVYLAIKCAWEIDEAGIARVAACAGVERAWLAAAVEQARRSLESERARVEALTQRRNASWCRQRLLEARIAAESDSYRLERLEAARDRELGRFDRIQHEISSLRTVVPNSLVARILGVPKGTVDSGLFYLRKHYGPPD